VQELGVMAFRRSALVVVASIVSLILTACATPAQGDRGSMTPIDVFSDLEGLQDLYSQYSAPLVVIDGVVFVPDVVCYECQSRRTGGDTEGRQVGGDTEGRQVGGDTEGRQVGGDTEGRQVGGNTEGRQVGGDTEGRQVGGDTEGRQVGGDTEGRQAGGDTEGRQVGGDTEGRQVGGDTEGRQVGGTQSQISCQRTLQCDGFTILGLPQGVRVQYYDGEQLIDVQGGFVRLFE